MSLFDEIRKLTQPYDENDEEYFDDDTQPEPDGEPTMVVAPRRDRTPRRDDPFADDTKPLFRAEVPQERVYREERPAYRPERPISRGTDFVQEFDDAPARPSRSDERVVNIHTTTAVQVVLIKPTRFEQAAEIADHLRSRRTVVINLETTNKDIARRLVDFLSGVAYANDGKIKKVAINTYIITPYNVDIMGDLIDELENSGVSFY